MTWLRMAIGVMVLGTTIVASGEVMYRDPDGWSIEILEQVPYSEMYEWEEMQPMLDFWATRVGLVGGYALQRAMAADKADYYRCILRVECPSDLMFGPGTRFTVYDKAGGSTRTSRLLFVDGLGRHQCNVFDSRREKIWVCRKEELQWVQLDGDRGLPVLLHFPSMTTDGVDGISRLEFSEGR
jgi:hypothetical protein